MLNGGLILVLTMKIPRPAGLGGAPGILGDSVAYV
jgi:hypothetical protein